MMAFLDALNAASDIDRVNGALRHLMATYGITMYSFTYYGASVHSATPLKYSYASEAFDIWHQHYIAEGYQDVDTTMDDLMHGVVPIEWNLADQLAAATSERERQMRLDSIALGAEKGITFPLYACTEDRATFLVVQMKGQHCLDDQPDLRFSLFGCVMYYFDAIRTCLLRDMSPSDAFGLSGREMQVLSLLHETLSVVNIAAQLNITVRTVNFHIQNINKKLGVKNKHQSVAKALAKGIII